MDVVKEIWEAMQSRIKSPIFGYVLGVFIVLNWQPLFYVVFSGESAIDKFQYFDENTDWLFTYAFPIIFGPIFASIAPWVSYWGVRIAEHPVDSRRTLQLEAASKVLVKKQELAEARAILASASRAEEQDLIQKALNDQDALRVENEEERAALQEQIQLLREQQDELISNTAAGLDVEPSELAPYILNIPSYAKSLSKEIVGLLLEMDLTDSGEVIVYSSNDEDWQEIAFTSGKNLAIPLHKSHRSRLMYQEGILDLFGQGYLIQKDEPYRFQLSRRGYDLVDFIKGEQEVPF